MIDVDTDQVGVVVGRRKTSGRRMYDIASTTNDGLELNVDELYERELRKYSDY